MVGKPTPTRPASDLPANRPPAGNGYRIEPLAVSQQHVGSVLPGMSSRTWRRMNSAGVIPRPVRVGGRLFWRVRDLDFWLAMRCPDRATFEARMAEFEAGGD